MFAAKNMLMPRSKSPQILTAAGTYSGNAVGTGSSTTLTSGNITVTNPQTYVCCLTYSYSLSATAHTCTFGGTAMTSLSSAVEGSYIRTQLWGYQVPASKLNVASAFAMTAPSGYLGIEGFSVLGTVTAIGTTGTNGNSSSPLISVNTGPGQLAVGGVGCWNPPATIGNGFQVGTTQSASDVQVMALYLNAGASNVYLGANQSTNYWTMVGATLKTVY